MNNDKMGALIRKLRTEQNLTQLQLAQQLCVSDKTVSKWERGKGCPDVMLLPKLAAVLQVQLDALMQGKMERNAPDGGNMRKLKFYVCPQCGNLLTSTGEANVICCGKAVEKLPAVKADETEMLKVEWVEDELYITSDHEMTKAHSIAFVALIKGDTLLMKRTYPEWNLELRLPGMHRAMLIYYCTRHGLKYQMI